MRIAVDMHFLQGKYQGIKTVLIGLYEALCRRSTSYEYLFIFTHPDEISDYWNRYGDVAFIGDMRRAARLIYGMSRVVRNAGNVDVSHFNAVVPFGVSGKIILTIHDMLFITHPQYFGTSFRLKQRLAAEWSMRRADIITSVSEYTLGVMSDLYPSQTARYRLLRNGVNLGDYDLDLAKAKTAVRASYGLSRYILTVGRVDPRKNHKTMLEAFDRLAYLIPKSEIPTFVIVGEIDNNFDTGRRFIEDMQARLPVVWLRNVDDAMLRKLYQAADFLVMASHAEGFGLPLVEAMGAGTPVIAADNTALPEVLGPCGLLVSADDSDGFADCYRRIIVDHQLAVGFASCGRERAHSFAWEKAADTYLRILGEFS